MSKLIPVQRVDKNGKVVTRNIRPDKRAASSKKAIPAVVERPVTKAEREAKKLARGRENTLLLSALTKLREVGVHVVSSGTAQHNVMHLIKHHPEILGKLIRHLGEASDAERDVWEHQLYDKQLFPSGLDDDHDYSKNYADAINLFPLASLITEGRSNTFNPKLQAASLASRVSSFSEVEGRHGEYEWMQAVMLISGSSKGVLSLDFRERQEDIEFIMKNREAIEPHLASLLRRDNWSKEFVSDVITNEAPAISEGIL